MRKRLRKKKHLGEFREYGVYFAIRFDKTSRNMDAFLDAFVLEAIEANSCYCGVGGKTDGDLITGFIELGRDTDNFMGRLAAIKAWVSAQSDILAYVFSPLTDAWHGPFNDSDVELKPDFTPATPV